MIEINVQKYCMCTHFPYPNSTQYTSRVNTKILFECYIETHIQIVLGNGDIFAP